MLYCKFILAPGEELEALKHSNAQGYVFESFKSDQTDCNLEDSIEKAYELNSYLQSLTTIAADKPYVRALRNAWYTLLTQDKSIEDNDFVILGESDAVPTVDADVLQKHIEDILIEHPETDVIRLFSDHENVPHKEGAPIEFFKWEVENLPHTRYQKEKFGTHALVIPVKSREKLAEYIRTWKLPVDTLIEYLSNFGMLNVMSAKTNLFYQAKRNQKALADTLYSNKDHKFALLMTSYKRPSDLLRQIYAMMDQDYPKENYHMYVAVKGIDDVSFAPFYSIIQHFIEEGRLDITLCSNSDQLTNFLDTIRVIPEEALRQYDKFLKIDDDDFYRRDYLKQVNEFCKRHSPDMSTCARHMNSYLMKTGVCRTPYLQPAYNSFYGNTLVFPYKLLNVIRRTEVDKDFRLFWERQIPKAQGVGNTEDALIDTIMLKHGCVFLNKTMGESNWCTITAINNPSIQRGGLMPESLRMDVLARHPDKYEKEYIVSLQLEDGKDAKLHVYAGKGSIVSDFDSGICCDVLHKKGNELHIKWHSSPTKTIIYQRESTFLPFVFKKSLDNS